MGRNKKIKGVLIHPKHQLPNEKKKIEYNPDPQRTHPLKMWAAGAKNKIRKQNKKYYTFVCKFTKIKNSFIPNVWEI